MQVVSHRGEGPLGGPLRVRGEAGAAGYSRRRRDVAAATYLQRVPTALDRLDQGWRGRREAHAIDCNRS